MHYPKVSEKLRKAYKESDKKWSEFAISLGLSHSLAAKLAYGVKPRVGQQTKKLLEAIGVVEEDWR